MNGTKTKINAKGSQTLQAILEEVRRLRQEVMLLFPSESIKDYAHPQRIKRSYEKALKRYPPSTI